MPSPSKLRLQLTVMAFDGVVLALPANGMDGSMQSSAWSVSPCKMNWLSSVALLKLPPLCLKLHHCTLHECPTQHWHDTLGAYDREAVEQC